MEFYLVQDSVTVAQMKEACQRTADLEDFTSVCDEWIEPEEEHMKLSLEEFSVDLNSFEYEEQFEDEQGFGGEVNRRLRTEEQIFAGVKVELLIFNGNEEFEDKYGKWTECHHGYLLLSGVEPSADSNKRIVNILQRLEDAFGGNEVHFDIELNLAHLPSKGTHPILDSGITLKASNLKYCGLPQRIGGDTGRIPITIDNLWRDETGFIKGMLSVRVKVDKDGANYFLKFGNPISPEIRVDFDLDLNRRLLESGTSRDVEILCRGGAVVKCHSLFLAANIKILENEWKAKKERPLVLVMKMGEEGVKGFLEWIYCRQVSKAAGEKCEVALDQLMLARQYQLKELETEMEELLMSKGTKDLKYFTVEAALNLYIEVKDDDGLRTLRDKAVQVLKNYIRTDGDKLNGSVEYQQFFRNDLQEAMKLSHLYGRLS